MGNPILVVEGDDTVRKLLKDWPKTVCHGYEIVEAKDEDEAVSRAEAESSLDLVG
jgi:hypothetical protein